MSVAVIATGGKQYVVHEGDEFTVEKLKAAPDETVTFTDLLHGKSVSAKVLGAGRDEKVRVVKFRSKVRYLRRRGHKQLHTKVKIESIA